MPTYNLTERTIEDLQREVARLRDALREIIGMCGSQGGIPWRVKERAWAALLPPAPSPHSDTCTGRVHDSLGCSCGADKEGT